MQGLNDKIINLDQTNADILTQQNNAPSVFTLTKDGSIKANSVKNAVIILDKDPNLKGLFKFNEFSGEVDVMKDVELDTDLGKINISAGDFTDHVLNSIELYIESQYEVAFKNALIDQSIQDVASMHSYNPVVDYMKKARKNWDKKQRLMDFFPDYLGAERNETTALITKLWFMGVVAKALDPRVKFDFVLDLTGGQGIGKTTMVKRLAPLGLYTDQFTDFTNKDSFEVMKNALIVNDDEMTASNSSSFEVVKKFVTMQTFEYRKAYARKVSRGLKKFVIVRTTNEVRYLKDKSGDRRFISIYANVDKQKKSPIDELPPELVEQLWGEAVWLYENAEDPFNLTKKQQDLLEENREHFRYRTGLEDELMDVLENDFDGVEFIENTKLSFKLFDSETALSHNTKESREIRYYMAHLGYDVGAVKKVNGKSIRGFAKRLQ